MSWVAIKIAKSKLGERFDELSKRYFTFAYARSATVVYG